MTGTSLEMTRSGTGELDACPVFAEGLADEGEAEGGGAVPEGGDVGGEEAGHQEAAAVPQ